MARYALVSDGVVIAIVVTAKTSWAGPQGTSVIASDTAEVGDTVVAGAIVAGTPPTEAWRTAIDDLDTRVTALEGA